MIHPNQTTVGEITPAEMIPGLLDQKSTGHRRDKKESTIKKRKNEIQEELLDVIALAGLEEWKGDEKRGLEAHNKICRYLCYK